jgi:hypothetical protein
VFIPSFLFPIPGVTLNPSYAEIVFPKELRKIMARTYLAHLPVPLSSTFFKVLTLENRATALQVRLLQDFC